MRTNTKPRPVPENVSSRTRFRLREDITALELTPGGSRGELWLGALANVSRGAVLELCGAGFNMRSALVNHGGHLYFVYLRDLEGAEQMVACPNLQDIDFAGNDAEVVERELACLPI